MRPIVRGPVPQTEAGEDVVYSDYRKARGALIERMGEYCSYCEMKLHASLAVEHTKPKNPNPRLENCWDNFLLACTNCNSVKGVKNVDLDHYFWPDTDNTFMFFSYGEEGIVKPSEGLSREETDKACRTIRLTGLDRTPDVLKIASDRRWIGRRDAWGKAQDSKEDLKSCDSSEMRRQIVRSVNGFWSVWMTVFHDDPDMRRRFIEAFPGTCRECFDSDSGYAPIPR